MWLVTRDGFYSVVEQRGGENEVLVRTRTKAHAKYLLRALGDDRHPVVDLPSADYRFRVVLPRAEWARYLALASDGIDYDSHFKEVVRDAHPKRAGSAMYQAMMSTWAAFSRLQPTPPYGRRPRAGSGGGAFFDFEAGR